MSLLRWHVQHFYPFTTPYIVFSEKSIEKSKFLGQLSLVLFLVARLTFLPLHYSLYSLLRKNYGKVQILGAVEFCPFLRWHIQHYYAFTTPYIIFSEKSMEKSWGNEFCPFLGGINQIFMPSLQPR